MILTCIIGDHTTLVRVCHKLHYVGIVDDRIKLTLCPCTLCSFECDSCVEENERVIYVM